MRLNLQSFRALPSSLFARMTLILFAGLLAAQLGSIWLQWRERATVVSQARGLNFTDRLADAVRALEAGDPAQRDRSLATLQSTDLRVTLINDDQVSPNQPRGQIQAMVAARLGSERDIRSVGGSGGGGGMQHGGPGTMPQRGMRNFDVRLNDGQWVSISAVHETDAPPALPADLITNLLLTLIIVSAVVMIAVRQATKPLKHLATAADTLGRNLDAPPLAEEGPAETRRATQAFNRIQSRIKRLVDERARAGRRFTRSENAAHPPAPARRAGR